MPGSTRTARVIHATCASLTGARRTSGGTHAGRSIVTGIGAARTTDGDAHQQGSRGAQAINTRTHRKLSMVLEFPKDRNAAHANGAMHPETRGNLGDGRCLGSRPEPIDSN